MTRGASFTRPPASTPELDAAERLWWERFAEVEERFCWVQKPFIQRFLRGEYLRHIIKPEPLNGRIAELGCGTGWLSVLLVHMGAERVLAIDLSESQIRVAAQRAYEAGIDSKIDFLLLDASRTPRIRQRFEVVLIHGFLHHLTTSEIRRVVETAREMLVSIGRLVVFEPVVYFSPESNSKARRLTKYQGWLEGALSRVQHWGLAKPGCEERRMRALIAERIVGRSPRGPSPKEMPFAPDELPLLLAPHFRIKMRRRCMARSHLVAQEVLLLELSHPWLAWLVRWPLLLAARELERRLLNLENPPSSMWIFEMFECVPSEGT